MRCAKLLSHVWLCRPMDRSPPGSSGHGILRARTLEWVVMSSSRGYSRPTGWPRVAYISCISKQVLNHYYYGWWPSKGIRLSLWEFWVQDTKKAVRLQGKEQEWVNRGKGNREELMNKEDRVSRRRSSGHHSGDQVVPHLQGSQCLQLPCMGKKWGPQITPNGWMVINCISLFKRPGLLLRLVLGLPSFLALQLPQLAWDD